MTTRWLGFVAAGLVWSFVACTTDGSYGRLAAHLHSPKGFAEWERREATLSQTAEASSTRYRGDRSLHALRSYEQAVRAYLDHGFLLYRAYRASRLELPDGLQASLDRRTDELMDVADEYLRQGSTAMGVGIAREIVLKYSDLDEIDRAQRRAEAVLVKYSYETDY